MPAGTSASVKSLFTLWTFLLRGGRCAIDYQGWKTFSSQQILTWKKALPELLIIQEPKGESYGTRIPPQRIQRTLVSVRETMVMPTDLSPHPEAEACLSRERGVGENSPERNGPKPFSTQHKFLARKARTPKFDMLCLLYSVKSMTCQQS